MSIKLSGLTLTGGISTGVEFIPPPDPVYATWNPADKGASIALSNGNLTAIGTVEFSYSNARATQAKSTGKWYFENTVILSSQKAVGVCNVSASLTAELGGNINGIGMTYNAMVRYNNTTIVSLSPINQAGAVMGVAFDMDARTIDFYHNGVKYAGTYTLPAGDMYPMVSAFRNNNGVTTNFGETAWAFAPPVGYSGIFI